MFAVIFRAKTGMQDDEYVRTVSRMRELAFEKYGCIDFIAVTENDQEIAISYWATEDAIVKWKSDAEHCLAQKFGRKYWYKSYTVQIVEIKREYQFNSNKTAN